MASPIQLALAAPPLPPSWSPPKQSEAKSISSPVHCKLLPVGSAYLGHVRRAIRQLSFADDDKYIEEERQRAALLNGGSQDGEDDLGVGEEEESDDLLLLDPKEWKKQDHYAVLGLSHLRYTATPQQIKIAHRKKVLKHHPDKKAGTAGSTNTNDDAFFKCISKALEVLSNPEKRRQFDSVDPHYAELEQDVPTLSEVKKASEKNPLAFFKLFGPVIEREARFSRIQPVPLLGKMDDSKESVENFYNFWYNFDSWRSFEYLDKEVNEGSDSRDDKRYTERKNKTERARRKKEDTARLRTLVDLLLSQDPRMKRIKQEEKEARANKKKPVNGVNGVRKLTPAEIEAEKKKAEEDKKAKEEQDKKDKEDAKKAKAAAANAAKKARRAARANEA